MYYSVLVKGLSTRYSSTSTLISSSEIGNRGLTRGMKREAENIYSSMVPNVCPGKEYKRRRIFISERELSLSEVVGKKDKMSNRAEQLSDRAKRG